MSENKEDYKLVYAGSFGKSDNAREVPASETGKCCSDCEYFGYESPCHDQPYPEFWCIKGRWDGISSYEELDEPTDCSDWTEKKPKPLSKSMQDAMNRVRGAYKELAVLDDFAGFEED